MECPKCHEKIAPSALVPEQQVLAIELEYEGPYMAAATLGGVISNMEQLLVSIAKDAGADLTVFIKGISYGDHKARVEFMMIRRLPSRTSEPQ